MKLVNPIGKKPVEKTDLKAYACVCTGIGTDPPPHAAVFGYGHIGCSYCGCSCGGGADNYSANYGIASAANY